MIKYIYEHNFNTSNFFLISKILRNIKFYFLYFYLPYRQTFLTDTFVDITIHDQKNIHYQVHTFPELTQDQFLILKNHTNLKKIHYFFYHSLCYLKLLSENRIILNFNNQNIIFLEDSFFFSNFFHSISIPHFKDYQGKIIFSYLHKYISFEGCILHVLYSKVERNSLFSNEIQQEIIDLFIEKQVIFSLFDKTFEERFKKEYFHYSNKFVNHPIQEYIDFLFYYHKKWDVFSLSSYFFHLYYNCFERNNETMMHFLNNHFNNIEIFDIFHPNCSLRIHSEKLESILINLYKNNS